MKRVPIEQLATSVGADPATGPWLTVDQARIDRFADATEDHQFIHVDADKAARTPFGGTIAHGFLTLSLIPHLCAEVTAAPEGTVMGINYGLNKVRFLQPVKEGSEIRAQARVKNVTDKGNGRVLVTSEVTVEIRSEEKPALVAETLTLFVTGGKEEA